MGQAKRRPTTQKRRGRITPPVRDDSGTSGRVSPALEGRPPAKRKVSVQDPIGDWPETDAVADEWLIERGQPEDSPDR